MLQGNNNTFSGPPQAISGQGEARLPAQDNKAGEFSASVTKPPALPENSGASRTLQAALKYAAAGKPVFPCHPESKKPLTRHGYKDATTDAGQIERWWNENPQAMIGMPTGDVSGLFVIDCDEDGVDHFGALCAEHNYDPQTLRAKTARGYHQYYQMPKGKDIRSSASKLAPHVDVRANGGYTVTPPSCRSNGAEYVWEDSTIKPAMPPDWLVDLLVKPQEHSCVRPEEVQAIAGHEGDEAGSSGADHHQYVKAAIKNECARVAAAKKGVRNNTLFSAACNLGQLIWGGVANEEAVRADLMDAAAKCGLIADDGEHSALAAIRSGFERGKECPRGIPEERNNAGNSFAGGQADDKEILPPPPPVPLEAFPPPIQALIRETASAFNAPMQVATTSLLAMLSCLVGRKRAIEVKCGWREPGNVWLVLIGSSGVGKTPVTSTYFRPIEEREYALYEQWKRDCEYYELEKERYRKAKPGERGEAPEPPRRQQSYLNDATPEAVADALESNPSGILWKTDEFAGTVAEFDKYSSSGKVGGTKARLLSSYDCQPWKSSRRDAAKNRFIPAACVSILGGIQPGMMPRVFDGSDKDCGFLQRFIFIRAERDGPALWSETTLSKASEMLLRHITAHLSSFEMRRPENGPLEPYVVHLLEEAKALFVRWHDALAREGWTTFDEETSDALTQKLKGQALRLCLLLHCLDAVFDNSDGLTPVPESTMNRALLLANWVRAHQIQVWSMFSDAEGSKKAKVGKPIQRALMQAIVEHEAYIRKHLYWVSNKVLTEWVSERVKSSVDPSVVGKAASSLKLPEGWRNRVRGRMIYNNMLDFFKSTVAPVASVVQPTEPCASDQPDTSVCKVSEATQADYLNADLEDEAFIGGEVTP